MFAWCMGAPLAQLVECRTWSQGRWFESPQRLCVVSLSKTLHLHCLVLVQSRKTSRHDWKIVDPIKQTKYILRYYVIEKLLYVWVLSDPKCWKYWQLLFLRLFFNNWGDKTRYNWATSWEKLSLGFPIRSDTSWAVQPQKMARGLKFQI